VARKAYIHLSLIKRPYNKILYIIKDPNPYYKKLLLGIRVKFLSITRALLFTKELVVEN